jgi:predicted transcriptional regulator
MKRGRPTIRIEVQKGIIEVLSSTSVPMNTSSITKNISKKLNKNLSWNTVQKYLDELVKLGKIQTIKLPHSKQEGKEGLTLYTLKK